MDIFDTVHSPEPEALAQIERLNMAADEICKKMEQADSTEDRRALDRQLDDIQRQIRNLQQGRPS